MRVHNFQTVAPFLTCHPSTDSVRQVLRNGTLVKEKIFPNQKVNFWSTGVKPGQPRSTCKNFPVPLERGVTTFPPYKNFVLEISQVSEKGKNTAQVGKDSLRDEMITLRDG